MTFFLQVVLNLHSVISPRYFSRDGEKRGSALDAEVPVGLIPCVLCLAHLGDILKVLNIQGALPSL